MVFSIAMKPRHKQTHVNHGTNALEAPTPAGEGNRYHHPLQQAHQQTHPHTRQPTHHPTPTQTPPIREMRLKLHALVDAGWTYAVASAASDAKGKAVAAARVHALEAEIDLWLAAQDRRP